MSLVRRSIPNTSRGFRAIVGRLPPQDLCIPFVVDQSEFDAYLAFRLTVLLNLLNRVNYGSRVARSMPTSPATTAPFKESTQLMTMSGRTLIWLHKSKKALHHCGGRELVVFQPVFPGTSAGSRPKHGAVPNQECPFTIAAPSPCDPFSRAVIALCR